jgi:hypothetical protein
MDTIEIIAQAIGIVAMVMNILSYQQKSQKGIIFFQLCGGTLFSINFLLLGAYVGSMLNIIGVIRAVIYLNKDKLHANHPLWVLGLSAAFLSAYVLTFTVFGKEPTPFDLFIEALPVLSMILSTVSFSMKSAKAVRILSLIGSPCWLVYNIFAGAIGAICCEIICEISIIIGILRYDIKRRGKDSAPKSDAESEIGSETVAITEEN